MALIIKDRVKEGSTTTGTGDITLAGAPVRFAPFNSFMVDGDTTYYAIVHTGTGVDEWEVGLGTWNTGNTLSRTTVLGGTNGASAVDFSAGNKDVFMTYPAAKALYFDASGNVSLGGDLDADGNVTIGGYIDLASIAHPAHQEGRVYYDNVHKALAYNTDVSGVEINLGQEEWIRVYNNTGVAIDAGKPVYWSGNSNGVPTIGLGNGTEESKYNVQGLTTASIANGAYGYVTISGVVRNIDTSSLTAGQNVFLGLADGALQNASPTYPNFPMCIGWVIASDATEGAILVNQQNHSVNSFRVRTDAHVAGDMIIGGDLTVLGSQTIASSSNISIANAWNYFNSGDTIGTLSTSFTGTGLNDASLTGHFTGPTTTTYYVEIDGVGTGTGGVDTFKVSRDNFVTTDSSGNDIDGTDQLIHSLDNIAIKFEATTGHTLGDKWTGTASPINVDTGFATNRNTGATGVGYTHMGIFFDVSAGKWVIFDEYDPEPEGTINTADASFSYGTLKGDTFEGNLLGNVTGNVSGNVTGSLTGNVTGNVSGSSGSTTGNAATATALQTSRTIQLTGDVTGSATFNGTANAVITAVVQDDSHAHIISNVDGLQTALDAKTDKTTTVSAGTGLTGGGDLSVNRTLSLDTTYTDGRYVNATGDTMTGNLDVQGTVTADGLTVDGNPVISGTSPQIFLQTSNASHYNWQIAAQENVSGAFEISSGNADADATNDTYTKRLVVNNNGDISFYEDTGAVAQIVWDASADALTFGDNVKATFGAGSDLQIYHDGLNSYIKDAGDGVLNVQGSAQVNIGGANGTIGVQFVEGANVTLRHNNSPKLSTASTGIDVTGDVTVSGNAKFGNANLYTSGDSNSLVVNAPTAFIPHSTTTSSNASLGLSSYRWDGVYSSTGDFTGNITVAGTVDGRDVAADGTKLDGIEAGATADQTAAEILTAIKTVDGAGSGLDADLLDGLHESSFMRRTATSDLAMANYNITGVNHITINDPGPNEGIEWSGGNGWKIYESPNDLTTNGAGNLQFVTGTTGRMTIDTSGNINGATFNATSTTNGGFQGIDADSATSPSFTWSTDLNTGMYRPAADQIGFTTGGTVACTITGSNFNVVGALNAPTVDTNSVVIGAGVTLTEATDRPDLLKITSSTATWGGIQISNTSNEFLWSFMGDGTVGGIYDDLSNAWAIQFDDGGEVRLYYAGAEKLNTLTGGVYVTGDFTASGNVTAYSDERLKTNIQTLDGALDKVKQLRGVSFEKDGRQDIGVIAQEVQAVVPEVVDTTHEYLSVAYGNMVGLLIEAIKEQQQQIDDLKAKLEAK